MYKVFIKDSSLSFTNSPINSDGNWLRLDNEKMIPSLIADLENLKENQDLNLICTDLEKIWASFLQHYTIIDAAGGVVRNSLSQLLMIYRLGKWDLPKGKIEEGEAIKEAAIREVEEECGMSDLQILRALPNTYHTYYLKGERILKRTYWFEMQSSYEGVLTPQIEEDIQQVKWVELNDISSYMNDSYSSIKDLLEDYLKS